MTVRRSEWTTACPVCARWVVTTGHGGHTGDRGVVRARDPRPVLGRHSVRGRTCPGSWWRVDYPPAPVGADTWMTWAMHDDACRTADGDACVCPLQTPPRARPDRRTAHNGAQCRDPHGQNAHRGSEGVSREEAE